MIGQCCFTIRVDGVQRLALPHTMRRLCGAACRCQTIRQLMAQLRIHRAIRSRPAMCLFATPCLAQASRARSDKTLKSSITMRDCQHKSNEIDDVCLALHIGQFTHCSICHTLHVATATLTSLLANKHLSPDARSPLMAVAASKILTPRWWVPAPL